ncbi:Aldehyde/histidinol dehydrogenase [Suillus fuscotomentosus]|uniref:Aldehyde/histidinol dehydrogenase n=1 Tax=Suillus fuscotomentosus TaxID=1912939 RepID=A0AAD4HMX3_9AGAM|nr:Aldehyde/histidinol dehydrogenase [Suillus fuscotomentosus]KAG1901139.1 Aldehyde/histidinol dehydrogenase [Suillus fuscotomentosus]
MAASFLTEQVRAIKVGDPFSPDTYQGPQVSNTQFERIMGYIASGQKDGATVHLGSKQIGREGYFIEPIIFILLQVVEQANDTSYRLAALVFTEDIDRAIRIAHAFEAGTAWINCSNQAEISMPFRGFMQSGIGCDLSKYALENYTNVKAVQVNNGLQL